MIMGLLGFEFSQACGVSPELLRPTKLPDLGAPLAFEVFQEPTEWQTPQISESTQALDLV